MTVCRFLACAAVVATTAVAPAYARAPSAFATRLMGRVPTGPKTLACFARSYDAAHLAAHPDQKVTWMEAMVAYYGGLENNYQLRIGFRFRGRPDELTTAAECGSRDPWDLRDEAICSGPSEGESRLRLAGRHAVLITLPHGIHLWRSEPSRPTDTVDDAFGTDDKLLRLDRQPLSRCADLGFESEQALIKRHR